MTLLEIYRSGPLHIAVFALRVGFIAAWLMAIVWGFRAQPHKDDLERMPGDW